MQTQQSSDRPHAVVALNNGDDVTGPVTEEEQKGGKKPRRTYVCQTCQKSFKRREHCMRHERGHTKEKPYLCRYCKRSYARRDLVTRHEKSLHAGQWTAPPSTKSKATTNGVPPQDNDIEQDESESSNAQDDDVSHEDGDSGAGGMNIHIPLTPGDVDGTRAPFTMPETFVPSTPPSLDDLLSLQGNGFGHGFGSMSAISADFMETSPALNVATNPFDAFQAINTSDLTQQHRHYSQSSSNQYNQMPNGTYNHNPSMPNFTDPSMQTSHPRRDSWVNHLTTWAEAGATQSDSPSSVGKMSSKVPTFEVDDAVHNYLIQSMCNHYLAPHLRRQFRIPSKNIVERCISSYLTCFHFHFPIVHIASLNLSGAPAPLVLAMCAIGALFRLERKHAVNFRECVDQALASVRYFDARHYPVV
jgi:hypothetical protein